MLLFVRMLNRQRYVPLPVLRYNGANEKPPGGSRPHRQGENIFKKCRGDQWSSASKMRNRFLKNVVATIGRPYFNRSMALWMFFIVTVPLPSACSPSRDHWTPAGISKVTEDARKNFIISLF